jgi:subtilisin family serine protease
MMIEAKRRGGRPLRLEKLDLGAALAYQAYLDRAGDPDRPSAISVVLTLDGDVDAVAAAGFEVHWTGRDEAVGTLRWSDLDAVTELPEVVRIAAGMPRMPHLDTAAVELRARATTVASIGTDGLWHAAKPTGVLTVGGAGASGAGVIVGVIDTGIDISHPAFCSAQVPYVSRILKIWDQGLTPVVADGEKGPDVARLLSAHTYGVEFDTHAIETALNASLYPVLPVDFRHKDCEGHGTHVASTAAGGSQVAGGSDASFVGIAPAADIIMVKMLDVPDVIRDDTGTEVGSDVRFRDAVMYILREAAAQVPAAKPVVINASFGSSFEPGDGLSDDERFMDDLFDPAHAADATHVPKGAIFVKASGNDGDPTDRGYAIVTIPDSGQIVVPFELFDDRGPNKASKVNCQPGPYVPPVLATAWYREVTAPADVGFSAKVPGDAVFSAEVFSGKLEKFFDGGKRRTLFHNSFTVARPVPPPPATVSVVRNQMMLFVEPKKLPPPAAPLHREGIYELRFTGPPGTVLHVMGTIDGTAFGRFGLRIATEYQNHDPLPGPEIVNGSATPVELIDVTSRQTIADGGGSNVITVGAYDDRTSNLADFSSRGPLRDYSKPSLGPLAAKPEIAAPGVKINAALGQDSDDGVARLLTPGSVAGNRFTELQGTSMAAPMVAGIIALMLEKKADLNVDQARTALIASVAGRDGANPGPGDPGYSDAFGAGRPAALESHTNT